jgi:phosphoglycolate phosphatase
MNEDKAHPTVIFDLDGTLFRTESIVLPGVHSAITDLGLEQPPDERIKSLFAFGTPELCRRLFPGESQATLDELTGKVREYERNLVSTCGELYDGVRELLASLVKKKWILMLCTTSSRVYVDTVLDGLDIRHFFARIFCGDGGRSKTEHIGEIIAEYKDLVAMVGDRSGDIDAANENSIESIGVTYGYGLREEIAHATHIAYRVSEIGSILDELRIAILNLHDYKE